MLIQESEHASRVARSVRGSERRVMTAFGSRCDVVGGERVKRVCPAAGPTADVTRGLAVNRTRAPGVLDEVWKASRYRSDDSAVFAHPALAHPIDPTKLSRDYMRPTLKAAGITKAFRPWHDFRHTALTHEAAAGNPHAYVQAKAGHSQSTITGPLHPRGPRAVPWRRREGRGPYVRRRRVATRVANRALRRPGTRKAPDLRGFSIAGAGFDPATSGL